MIPDEAVEAAAKAMLPVCNMLEATLLARASLEAAAPHLQSAAWERGVEDGYHHRPNPYRKTPDAR